MQNLKVMNKKQAKEVLGLIKKQWGCDSKLDYVFLLSEKNRIYLISRDISKIDLAKLRINNVGLYFGEITYEGLRLGIEGAQLIGRSAKKNIVELDEKEKIGWLKGNDLTKELDISGFVIIKHKKDFLGTGKYRDGKILNYVPKARRLIKE